MLGGVLNTGSLKERRIPSDIQDKTINEFALEEGYDLILYKDIVFVSDEINITQQIIDKIEKTSL